MTPSCFCHAMHVAHWVQSLCGHVMLLTLKHGTLLGSVACHALYTHALHQCNIDSHVQKLTAGTHHQAYMVQPSQHFQ